MTGRKIYYKLIVRVCKVIEREEILRIVNRGYVIIEDERFEGYISLDYIEGICNEEEESLSIEIQDLNNPGEYFIFTGVVGGLELPGTYFLDTEVPNDNKVCYLQFDGIEKNPSKQKEIEKTLKEIKQLHEIPN